MAMVSILLRQGAIEATGRSQQDPGEKTGTGGTGPEHEETERVAQFALDLDVGKVMSRSAMGSTRAKNTMVATPAAKKLGQRMAPRRWASGRGG
jgi:hypothetical protein